MTAYGLVEVYAAVKIGGGTEPFVECHADNVSIFVVGAPAVNGEQRAAVNLESELAGVCNVERTHAVDEVVGRRHVAPGAELVDFDTDGVNDVVDAVLYDDASGPCHVHFDGEASGAFETVSGVGDAAVFAEDAGAAYCAADDGHVVEAFARATQREVIGPVLCRNGIAKTHQREILFFSEDVDGVQEINPVRFAREIVGERSGFCKIAVAVLAARKRACNSRACVHLRKVGEVEADIECFASGHVECDFVAQDFFTCGDCDGGVAAECDRDWKIG